MADLTTVALIGIYFFALLGIGTWASHKIRNTEDYILAGRSLGFWIFTILIRLAGDLGADLCAACGLVLYNLLRGEAERCGEGAGLHDRPGLPGREV